MIGETVKALRIKKGISQKELAYRSNMHQCQISKIEHGSRKISAQEISLLAKALEIKITDLLDTA